MCDRIGSRAVRKRNQVGAAGVFYGSHPGRGAACDQALIAPSIAFAEGHRFTILPYARAVHAGKVHLRIIALWPIARAS